jgi:hypothetical protein
MNAQIKKFFLPVLIPAVLFVPGASGQAARHCATAGHRRLVVSLPDRRLALVENGKVKKVYIVTVGTKSTPSPAGTFTIMNRVTNPSYAHDGKVVAPGPENPVGTRWMGLSAKGYGIHGTNAPGSIGKAASSGCIRMRKHDLEELFASVETGDQVVIVANRGPETAEIFGDAQSVEASDGAVKAAVPIGLALAEATPAVAIAAAMPLAR